MAEPKITKEMTNLQHLQVLPTKQSQMNKIIKKDSKKIDMVVSIKNKNNSILPDNSVDLKSKGQNSSWFPEPKATSMDGNSLLSS